MGYSQPWDPVPRLFTQYDPLYPLVDDLGEGEIYEGIPLMFFLYSFRCAYSSYYYTDGVTPYVNGPSRTLRPIVKALLEAWEGW